MTLSRRFICSHPCLDLHRNRTEQLPYLHVQDTRALFMSGESSKEYEIVNAGKAPVFDLGQLGNF